MSATDALKLTTYFGERDRAGGRFLSDALVDVYARHRLRTSLVMRGVAGFGDGLGRWLADEPEAAVQVAPCHLEVWRRVDADVQADAVLLHRVGGNQGGPAHRDADLQLALRTKSADE